MSLDVQNLHFSYGGHEVLKGVSFCAEYGEMLSVLGPNGVGKSTLFRCMLGSVKPNKGTVLVDGEFVQTMSAEALSRRVAYIPQAHHPVFNFSVMDMVLMGTTSRMGRFAQPGKIQENQALSALERMGILHLKDRGCANISGGERQLVLIARAIAQQAKILVMDEPTANLDFVNKIRVMKTVRNLTEDGYTVIQSTHDPDQADFYSHKILALWDGKVLAWGTPEDTISDGLISALYGVDVTVCRIGDGDFRVCVPAWIKKPGGEKI